MPFGASTPDPLEGLVIRMNENRATGVLLNGKKIGFIQRVDLGPLYPFGSSPDITLTFRKYREDGENAFIIGEVMEDVSNFERGTANTIEMLQKSAPWIKIKREYSLVAFFRGYPEPYGGIWSILSWDDSQLEDVHDWVQWVFPNREPSAYVDSPLLNDEIVQELLDPISHTVLLAAYARFGGFLHLKDEKPHWMTPGNHNQRRITRVLKFYSELGRSSENFRSLAEVLHSEVLKACERNPGIVTETTLGYWHRALDP